MNRRISKLTAVGITTIAVAFSGLAGNGIRELDMLLSGKTEKVEIKRLTQRTPVRGFDKKRIAAAFEVFQNNRESLNRNLTPAKQKLLQRVAASGKKLRGAMIDNSLWYTSTPEYGIYELSTTPGEPEYTAVKLDPKFYVMDAVYTGEVYWTSYAEENPSTFEVTSMTYYTYNPETWEVLNEQVGDKNLTLVTSTWSAIDEMAYVTYGNAGTTFGALMIEDGTLMGLGTVTKRLTAMACHSDGTLYGIDSEGNLVIINPLTGANVSIVGNTGVASYWRTSGAIDSENNIFYYFDCGSSKSSVWAIDLSTAESVKLYDLPNSEQMVGLYVATDNTDPLSPASAENLAFNFEGKSLTGSISFKVPSTFYDGSSASGDVSYTAIIDNDETITEPSQWGELVTIPISFENPGEHTFTVQIHNDHGDSKLTSLTSWIGEDVPKGVSNAKITWSNGQFKISWSAPTESQNGGYFNPEEISYSVVRMPDEVTIAEGITVTEIYDEVSEPENQIISYSYKITTYADGLEGETVTTSKKSIGYLIPPYFNSFDSSADIAGYTAVDSNEDGKKWGYNTSAQAFRIQYNSSKAMDDWLFTPEILLQEGHAYTFSFKARAHNNTNPERIEAAIATAAKVNSIVEYIVEPTDITSSEWVTLSGTFVAPSSGRYRLGLHGISDKDRYYLYADDIEVSEGATGNTPGSVTNLIVTPAQDGSLSATVSFEAPAVDINGNPISELTKIELSRNNELIHQFDNPTPGASLNYIDSEAPARNVSYSVTAYNSNGKGATTTVNVFIGYDAPQPVSDLKVTLGSNTGEAILSWNAPATDLNGKELSADAISYTVVRTLDGVDYEIAENIATTQLSDQALAADAPQMFVSYSVIAITTGGESPAKRTQLIPLGKPYDLPFAESFANGRISFEWGLESSNQAAGWMLGQDSSIDEINSEDDDNGLAIMQALTPNSWASLVSGSISIPSAGTTVLNIAYYNYSCSNKLEVLAREIGSEQDVLLKEVTLSGDVPEGWKTLSIDLDAFRGKNIQLVIRGTIIDSSIVVIDNIRVTGKLDNDLAIRSVSMPARVIPGKEFEVAVKVENIGLTSAEGFSVELIAGDETVDEILIDNLYVADTRTVVFTQKANATDPEAIIYKVKINYPADNNPENNISDEYVVMKVISEWPSPENITASIGDNNEVVLNWDTPSIVVTQMSPLTDNLSDYTPFSSGMANSQVFDDYIGDWIMVDRDGVVPYDITSQGQVVEFPNSGRPVSFMVIEPSIFNSPMWDTHSGEKVFVSFASQYSANDDWMISPRLDGSAQQISFFARSLTTYYGAESFQIYYSTTDTKITSFTRVNTINEVPEEWTEYTFEVPAGARYFAIRGISDGTFALLIDDLKYTPANPLEDLQLMGFRIYRDGIFIGDASETSTSFIDSEPSEGVHVYNISALYNKGESSLSNSVTASLSNVSQHRINEVVLAGSEVIKILNPLRKQVSIYSSEGKLFVSDTSAEELNVPVLSGVYIVTLDNDVYKVIVR